MDTDPKLYRYREKLFEEYTKEELIEIAKEGWRMYHELTQSSIRAMNLLSDLHKATRK